jgi:hypothetical protein
MFDPFHGFRPVVTQVNPVKLEVPSNYGLNRLTERRVVETPPVNILQPITPENNNEYTYTPEDYGKLLIPREPIKFIQPEIIPREKPINFMADFQRFPREQEIFKPEIYNNLDNKPIEEVQNPRLAILDVKKEKEKGVEFDKDIKEHSLFRYKIDKDLGDMKLPVEKTFIKKSLKKSSTRPSFKRTSVKKSSRTPSIKFKILRPEIISKEKIKITSIKPSSKKPSKKPPVKKISRNSSIKFAHVKRSYIKSPVSKKSIIQVKKLNKILTDIDRSEKDFKSKYEQLKNAYIKQHESLLDIFSGYQKLYSKEVKIKKKLK